MDRCFLGANQLGYLVGLGSKNDHTVDFVILYIGYIALQSAIEDIRRSDRASAVLAIVGLAIVPVIYYSINCPNPNECASLHQESSLKRVESNILIAMMVTVAGFWMYSFAAILMRVRNIILQRESHTNWVERLEASK